LEGSYVTGKGTCRKAAERNPVLLVQVARGARRIGGQFHIKWNAIGEEKKEGTSSLRQKESSNLWGYCQGGEIPYPREKRGFAKGGKIGD